MEGHFVEQVAQYERKICEHILLKETKVANLKVGWCEKARTDYCIYIYIYNMNRVLCSRVIYHGISHLASQLWPRAGYGIIH